MAVKKIEVQTVSKIMLADIFTPVAIYLRLRDRFRDTVLLESTDFHAAENSYSFICINAIAGIEIKAKDHGEDKLPGQPPQKIIVDENNVTDLLWNFLQRFSFNPVNEKTAKYGQGLFGYTSFEAIEFFETIQFTNKASAEETIPLVRYRLYQYVIAINHFKDELFICENKIPGLDGDLEQIETIIRNKDVPVYPFRITGDEQSNLSNDEYKDIVKKAIADCYRG